jgi:hypothetical protein
MYDYIYIFKDTGIIRFINMTTGPSACGWADQRGMIIPIDLVKEDPIGSGVDEICW